RWVLRVRQRHDRCAVEERCTMPSMLHIQIMTMPEVFHGLESGWPFGEHQPMRTETYVDQGDFVVRCELPGVDPEKDIHIRVEGNQLEITAERKSEERS